MDIFNQLIGDNNPFDGIDIGRDADPFLADIDGDGDLDAIFGEQDGNLNFFENIGDATDPDFTERLGRDNPFLFFNLVQNISFLGRSVADSDPSLVDIDGDGDLDVVVGSDDGTLLLGLNTGDANNPIFTSATSVIPGVDVGIESSPAFGDTDGDGDLDLIIGDNNGNLFFFENTGDVNNPTFTALRGADNPFDGVDVGSDADPAFIDIDGDGDLDLIVGEQNGNINFFENTSDANTLNFTQRFGVENPFDGVDVGTDAQPAVADINGDGRLDVIVGEDNGTVNFFENVGPIETDISLVDTSLTITDINGGNSADTLTLTEIENILLRIEDPNQAFQVSDGVRLNDFNRAEISRRTVVEEIPIGLEVSPISNDNNIEPVVESITINTLAGDDSIIANTTTLSVNVNAGTGNDTVIGGEGADSITGGQGEDSIEGRGGNDLLLGLGNNDTLNGGSGDDRLFGGGGNDLLQGSNGQDTLNGANGRDTIAGESGDDIILGGGGSDSLLGGSGNDSITGVAGFDVLNGGNGEDTLNGGSGRDTLNGGSGRDTLIGGGSNDLLTGAEGADSLSGGQGSDRLNGGAGNDSLNGGSGNDLLIGSGGNDLLDGSSGRDSLNGGSGNDSLNGGSGNDNLIGGAGNDFLVGGPGLDLLNGTDSFNLGVNERDTLVGSLGSRDQFVLGDSNSAFYLDEGSGATSLARIRDFESLDTIILNGSSSDYRIATNGGNSTIFRREAGPDDAIAIIENTVGLNLNGDQFSFV